MVVLRARKKRSVVVILMLCALVGCSQSPEDILRGKGIEVSDESLILQIQQGDKEVVSLLLDAGVDANSHESVLGGPIFAAIEAKNMEILRLLLDKGANPNAQNTNTNTPLIKLSREYNSLEMLDLLVEHGADINKFNESKRTPLMYAINSGAFPLAMRLMELGAESLEADAFGVTPIILAAGQNHVGLLDALLSAGANVNSQNQNGASVLLIAASNLMYDGVLETLLKYDADFHAVDQNGTSVLMNVAWKGSVKNLKLLVEKGVNIEAVDSVGRSALYYAIDSGSVEKVDFLVRSGAKLNILDKFNTSLLIKAAQYGDPEIFGVLMETKKIDIDIKDSENHSALDYAKANGFNEIVALIGSDERPQ